jgi:hypothetical protein
MSGTWAHIWLKMKQSKFTTMSRSPWPTEKVEKHDSSYTNRQWIFNQPLIFQAKFIHNIDCCNMDDQIRWHLSTLSPCWCWYSFFLASFHFLVHRACPVHSVHSAMMWREELYTMLELNWTKSS